MQLPSQAVLLEKSRALRPTSRNPDDMVTHAQQMEILADDTIGAEETQSAECSAARGESRTATMSLCSRHQLQQRSRLLLRDLSRNKARQSGEYHRGERSLINLPSWCFLFRPSRNSTPFQFAKSSSTYSSPRVNLAGVTFTNWNCPPPCQSRKPCTLGKVVPKSRELA